MNNGYNPANPIVEQVRVLDGTLEFRDLLTNILIFSITAGQVTFYGADGATKTLEVTDTSITYKGSVVGTVGATETITLADFTKNIPCAAGQIMDLTIYAENAAGTAVAAMHVEIMNWKATFPMNITVLSDASHESLIPATISVAAGVTGVDINIKDAVGGNLTYSYTTRMLM